jgi:hypothetical protein
MRDEEIKMMMFSEILQKEVANQAARSRQPDLKTRTNTIALLDSGRTNTDIKDLVRYKSMIQESEQIFKKEMEEKVTMSLFAGDKFFKVQMSSAPDKTPKAEEQIKLDPNR